MMDFLLKKSPQAASFRAITVPHRAHPKYCNVAAAAPDRRTRRRHGGVTVLGLPLHAGETACKVIKSCADPFPLPEKKANQHKAKQLLKLRFWKGPFQVKIRVLRVAARRQSVGSCVQQSNRTAIVCEYETSTIDYLGL
jgi:hypothetical protein